MDAVKLLADAAITQISEYPVMSAGEKCRRIAKRILLRQKQAPADHFSWPNALLGDGLLAAYTAVGEKEYLSAVLAHIKRWTESGCRLYYVDNVMNGTLALWIEELFPAGTDIDGDRRRALEICHQAQESCISWILAARKTGEGALPYRSQHPDWLFADTPGMVCPFLCRYGVEKKNENALRLGVLLLEQFLQKGMDMKTGLPYHGYDEITGMKYGIIGWGRACGWLMKGLSESLPYIPEDWTEYWRLLTAFQNLASAVCSRQRPDGGFSWQLEAMEGHRDTSAEGIIGGALVMGIRHGYLASKDGRKHPEDTGEILYDNVLARLSAVLKASFSQGRLENCSGECRGFSEYPQIFGSYPWGTGSALRFLAMYQIQ